MLTTIKRSDELLTTSSLINARLLLSGLRPLILLLKGETMSKIVLIALLLTLASNVTIAQDRQLTTNQITVLGSVELKEIADEASFTFSLKGVGSSLRLAVEDASKKMKILTNKLVELGISARNISTSSFYSGENYDDRAFLSSSRDYQATLTTLVKVDSLQLLESVLYLISESKVLNLSNITFSIKDELGFRRRARVAAALKAKEKAEDIAHALGVSLGRLLFVEETDPTRVYNQQIAQHYPSPFNPSSNQIQDLHGRSNVYESVGSAFFAQTISVTSQVKVIFELKESR